jgi:hypothetical protein
MFNVFFSNYHVSVDHTFVDDLLRIGATVIMPDDFFGIDSRIWFFRTNNDHRHRPGVKVVSYEEFKNMPRMAIVTPCEQMVKDFQRLYEERGSIDEMVYLTAQSNSITEFPRDAKYIISHCIEYHRDIKDKYKILYFSKPTVLIQEQKDFEKTFNEKQIKLYINNFRTDGFTPEYAAAVKFRDLYLEKTGYRIPFYGWDNEDGNLSMYDVQRNMIDSMYTLVFKRRETWGQMVNESMQLGTPCIFLNEFINNTLKHYEITEDNSIIGDSVEELVDKITSMSLIDYETLCMASQTISKLYCADEPRLAQLKWLFSKMPNLIR